MSKNLTNRKAMIIGAGIAGPALAIALQRAGIESVVYEASTTPRDSEGVFLNLAPNGLRVLDALGIGEKIEQLGFRNDHLIFQNESGRVLAESAVGGITIMRGVLSQALREAAMARGIHFEFGKSLQAIDEEKEQIIAHFADGTSAYGDLVIGCDGIQSRTRALRFPTAPKPTYTGIINLGSVTQTDLPSTGRAMHMIFGTRGFFGYAVRPNGESYWFSNFAQKQEPSRGELQTMSDSDWQQKLLALHRDDPPEVKRILHSLQDGISLQGGIGVYPVYDMLSLAHWQQGRVCLIGDSAHAIGPHVGQGASLALEDAFVLAKCLSQQLSIPNAFANFEELRRQRVERIVKQSRQTGNQKAPTGWLGRKLRDLILPIFLRKSGEAVHWLYDYPLE